MLVRVQIREVATGLTVVDEQTWDFDTGSHWNCPSDGVVWQWTEGNFGCDCNRELFFRRLRGETNPDPIDSLQPCSDDRFVVDWIEVDGVRLRGDRTEPE